MDANKASRRARRLKSMGVRGEDAIESGACGPRQWPLSAFQKFFSQFYLFALLLILGGLFALAPRAGAIPGDVSGDGALSSEDANLLRDHLLARKYIAPMAVSKADMDQNGILDISDLIHIVLAVPTPSPSPSVTPDVLGEITLRLPGDVPLILLRIPAGSFQMGSPATERSRESDEGPLHTVTFANDFCIGKYEVTQRQWLAVMETWPGPEPSSDYGKGDDNPAYFLARNDAKNFINALNTHLGATDQRPAGVRLPTEAEWEYACRAGTTTRFFFGDSLAVGDGCEDGPTGLLFGRRSDYMWFCGCYHLGISKPVGTRVSNAFGLYDMSGNVHEWCEDFYHNTYVNAPSDGSAWTSNPHSQGVTRGGSWGHPANVCRSAKRFHFPPGNRNNDVGFRVASDWPGNPTPSPTPTPTPTPFPIGETIIITLPEGVPLELVRIPAGYPPQDFSETGSTSGDNETQTRTATITEDFYMGKYEVTQRQWLSLIGAWPYQGLPPVAATGIGDQYPAYGLSWYDVYFFITALNGHITRTGQGPLTVRFPTEEEWEYACRAATTTRFYFGDSPGDGDVCEDAPAGTLPGNRSDYMWYCGNNTPNGSKQVGTKLPNFFHLYDMGGNVWEWCSDYFQKHFGMKGSTTPSPTPIPLRAMRGGYWGSSALDCRSESRREVQPEIRSRDTGFRLAADRK